MFNGKQQSVEKQSEGGCAGSGAELSIQGLLLDHGSMNLFVTPSKLLPSHYSSISSFCKMILIALQLQSRFIVQGLMNVCLPVIEILSCWRQEF